MTPIFNISKDQVMIVTRSFIHAISMGILGAVIVWLTDQFPGLLQTIINNPIFLSIALGIDHGIVKILTQYVSNEQGQIGGII